MVMVDEFGNVISAPWRRKGGSVVENVCKALEAVIATGLFPNAQWYGEDGGKVIISLDGSSPGAGWTQGQLRVAGGV